MKRSRSGKGGAGQKFLIVLLLLLCGVLAAVFYMDKKEKEEKSEQYARMEKEVRPLEVEKSDLLKELDSLEQSCQKQATGMGTMVFLFSSAVQEIYEDAFPALGEYGYTGYISISESSCPGMEGCMSEEQLAEMVSAGWRICLVFPADGESPSEAFEALKEKIAQMGYVAGAVCFPDGTYTAEYENLMADSGFSVMLHHGEEGRELITSEPESGMWHAGAIAWRSEGRNQYLSQAMNEGKNVTFLLEFGSGGIETDKEYLDSMLQSIEKYCKNEMLKVTDFDQARAYRAEVNQENGKAGQAMSDRMEEIQYRLSEIEAEISKIYESLAD